MPRYEYKHHRGLVGYGEISDEFGSQFCLLRPENTHHAHQSPRAHRPRPKGVCPCLPHKITLFTYFYCSLKYAGDNFVRYSGQVPQFAETQLFAWDASNRGTDVSVMVRQMSLDCFPSPTHYVQYLLLSHSISRRIRPSWKFCTRDIRRRRRSFKIRSKTLFLIR